MLIILEMQEIYISDKIVFDIETDGRDNILQVSYHILDQQNNIIGSRDFLIYDGEHSKPFYQSNITEEEIIENGINPLLACEIIARDFSNTNILIGHNIKSFDCRVINKFMKKNNFYEFDIYTKEIHDTMIESKMIVKATGNYGQLKYPKLSELYYFLFNCEIENYHNALFDCTATLDCYKLLCQNYQCFSMK